MKQHVQAELQILDRVMYLLEEHSVQHIKRADEQFADYIDELYTAIHNKSIALIKE